MLPAKIRYRDDLKQFSRKRGNLLKSDKAAENISTLFGRTVCAFAQADELCDVLHCHSSKARQACWTSIAATQNILELVVLWISCGAKAIYASVSQGLGEPPGYSPNRYDRLSF